MIKRFESTRFTTTAKRVYQGGSWEFSIQYIKSSNRVYDMSGCRIHYLGSISADFISRDLGFRIIRTKEEDETL